MIDSKLIIGILGLLLIAFLVWMFVLPKGPTIGVVGDIHNHADFIVFLDGEQFNFSQEKYMSGLSASNKSLSNFIHLHDMAGGIIHPHPTPLTILSFF